MSCRNIYNDKQMHVCRVFWNANIVSMDRIHVWSQSLKLVKKNCELCCSELYIEFESQEAAKRNRALLSSVVISGTRVTTNKFQPDCHILAALAGKPVLNDPSQFYPNVLRIDGLPTDKDSSSQLRDLFVTAKEIDVPYRRGNFMGWVVCSVFVFLLLLLTHGDRFIGSSILLPSIFVVLVLILFLSVLHFHTAYSTSNTVPKFFLVPIPLPLPNGKSFQFHFHCQLLNHFTSTSSSTSRSTSAN